MKTATAITVCTELAGLPEAQEAVGIKEICKGAHLRYTHTRQAIDLDLSAKGADLHPWK